MDSGAKVIDPINQKNPLHPDQTSVSVARRCDAQEWRQFPPKIPAPLPRFRSAKRSTRRPFGSGPNALANPLTVGAVGRGATLRQPRSVATLPA
jgi:hypothetical protein